MSSPLQRVVPALRVKSVAASMDFYTRLGFALEWEHRFGPSFPVFASIRWDGMQIFLTEHTGDCQFGGLVHFDIPSVDEFDALIRERGVAVDQPPANSLGPDLRDMVVVDPDGNRLCFLTRG